MAWMEPMLESYLDRPVSADAVIARAMASGDDVEQLEFVDQRIADIEGSRLEFSCCHFVRCRFEHINAKRVSFTDCVFDHCDFSNFSFCSCALARIRFENCRMTGATFKDATLLYARFTDCAMPYANFASCKFKKTWFERSDLSKSAFHFITHEGLRFDSSKLSASEWVNTKLAGVDLTSCQINGLLLSDGTLRGAIVSPEQLLDLASLLGVVVK